MTFNEHFDHLTRPSNSDRSQAFHRRLHANEADCIRRNINVRVEHINTMHKLAFCTVEQRLFGLCRRKRSASELVWRAEKALAPLTDLGLAPMITVSQGDPPHPASKRPGSVARWIQFLWHWSGYPLSPAGFKAVIVDHDPFGWRNAMMASIT